MPHYFAAERTVDFENALISTAIYERANHLLHLYSSTSINSTGENKIWGRRITQIIVDLSYL